jgi:eukaryotic-like serine/threonine-protein kinase
MKLLAKDPKDRYQSANALAGDLERVRGGLAPRAVDAETTQLLTAPLPPLPKNQDRTAATVVSPPAAHTRYPTGPQTTRRSGLLPALLIILLLIGLIGGVAYALTSDLFGGGNDPGQQQPAAERVEVPDVVGGFTQDEAVAELDSAGLEADPRPVESSAEDEGYVVEQDPVAGERAARGDAVTIHVGSGPPPATVPDLVWESDAPAALGAEGLVYGGATYEPNDTVPQGQVIRSDPAEGSEVDQGTAVSIIVSSGPEQQQYEAPPASNQQNNPPDASQDPSLQNEDGGGGRGRGRGRGDGGGGD